MLRVLFIVFVNLMLDSSTPQPPARVERIYWDHVEGFCVADSIGKEIYAGSRNRLYFSSDFGQNWTHLGDLPSITLIRQILPIGKETIIIIGSKGPSGECYVSTDSGRSFCKCLDSTGSGNCAAFIPENHTLFVACDKPFKLMRSEDSGCTWVSGSRQFDSVRRPQVCSILISNDKLGRIFYVSTSRPAAIYCKSELDDRWRKCFADPYTVSKRELPLVTRCGNRLVACLTSDHSPPEKIYLSDDWGATWRGVCCPNGIWGIGLDPCNPKNMWTGNYGTWLDEKDTTALQYTQDEGRTWQPIPNCGGQYFWQLQVLSNNTLYAATDFGLLRVKLN
jgi:hypothetical protein